MTTAAPGAARRAIFEPEQDDYRESFRRFLKAEVVPNYETWRAAHQVPRALFQKAAQHGFLAMAIPEEHGGSGVDDFRFNVVLTEEAGYAGVGDAWAGPGLHTDVCLPYFMESASEEQQQRWYPGLASGELIAAIAMTEPGTGSDLAGIQTRAVRDGGGWVINGSKTFITNGVNCDLVIVAARTSEDKHGGLSLVVVEADTPGFERSAAIPKLGQHASDTAELFFEDCRVPAENLLGAEGSGFVQLVSRLVPERLTLAVGALAGCEHVLAMTLEYVKERRAFGRPIGSFQHSRFVLAELQTEITIGRTFVDRCIERHVAGECSVPEAAMAKWWTTELLGRATDAGVQLHGGYGYTAEYEIGRAWADARVSRIYAGTNEIMKELIGRSMGL